MNEVQSIAPARLRPVVLLGASGMLGRAFVPLLEGRAFRVVCPRREVLDLAHPGGVRAGMAGLAKAHGAPVLVVNCAAWTDVDGAEAHEEAATTVNAESVRELALASADLGSIFVNFGTDYVFNGMGTSPYRLDEPREPLNAYGRSKARGEEYLEAIARERTDASWLHVRTSWLYAPWGKNFVRTIAGLLHAKPAISVVNDQRGRPTSAEWLAGSTLSMLEAGARGIQHATDGGECTWFEFAQEIGALSRAQGIVNPCTSAQFPRPAKRPAYSVLDIHATESMIGRSPHWKANLASVMARLEA